MDEKIVIEGVKERLYSKCELRPSEVLIIRNYINYLESSLKETMEKCEYWYEKLKKTDSILSYYLNDEMKKEMIGEITDEC